MKCIEFFKSKKKKSENIELFYLFYKKYIEVDFHIHRDLEFSKKKIIYDKFNCKYENEFTNFTNFRKKF